MTTILLTPREVAERLRIRDIKHARAIMRKMDHMMIGNRLLVTEPTLERWIHAQVVGPDEGKNKKKRTKASSLLTYNPDLFEPDGKGGIRVKRRRA